MIRLKWKNTRLPLNYFVICCTTLSLPRKELKWLLRKWLRKLHSKSLHNKLHLGMRLSELRFYNLLTFLLWFRMKREGRTIVNALIKDIAFTCSEYNIFFAHGFPYSVPVTTSNSLKVWSVACCSVSCPQEVHIVSAISSINNNSWTKLWRK